MTEKHIPAAEMHRRACDVLEALEGLDMAGTLPSPLAMRAAKLSRAVEAYEAAVVSSATGPMGAVMAPPDRWRARSAAPVSSGDALSDAQIMRIAGDVRQRNAGAWPGDVAFARAILAAAGRVAAPTNFGQRVTGLIAEIRGASSLAWRDSKVEELIELIEPGSTPAAKAADQMHAYVLADRAARQSAPIAVQGSIGDDDEFRALAARHRLALNANDLDGARLAWAALIAYIDARTASVAAPTKGAE